MAGAIVITDNQYEGKGRNNRHWLSISNKSLTFSILINKIIPAELIAWIPLIVSISIEKALSNFNINITLKWPNDLILDNKKLGGILCESKIIGNSLKKIVIGIGLNINETINELNSEDLKKLIKIKPFKIQLHHSIQTQENYIKEKKY